MMLSLAAGRTGSNAWNLDVFLMLRNDVQLSYDLAEMLCIVFTVSSRA